MLFGLGVVMSLPDRCSRAFFDPCSVSSPILARGHNALNRPPRACERERQERREPPVIFFATSSFFFSKSESVASGLSHTWLGWRLHADQMPHEPEDLSYNEARHCATPRERKRERVRGKRAQHNNLRSTEVCIVCAARPLFAAAVVVCSLHK